MARNTIEILFNTVFNGKGSKEANAAIGDTEQKAQGAKSGLDALVGGLTAAGLAYGAVEVAQRTWAAALEGQAAKKEQARFDALTESIGATGDVLEQLRDVTKGQATDLDLMASANQLMVMGLADSEQSLNDHFRIVSALKKPNEDFGTALENWSLMLANQSIPRLDSFGISSGKVRDRILELQAANKDMTRETAFMIATFEEAEGTIDKLGDSVDDAGDPFAGLQVKVENLTDKTKILVADGLLPLVTALDNLTDSGQDAETQLLNFLILLDELGLLSTTATGIIGGLYVAQGILTEETDALEQSMRALHPAQQAAIDGFARAAAEAGANASQVRQLTADLKSLADVMGVSNVVNAQVKTGLRNAGIITPAQRKELSAAFDSWAGDASDMTQKITQSTRSYGSAIRDLGPDYQQLADTVDSTGQRIMQIESNKNARLASEAQRLATFEEGLRDRVTDAWTAYYDEVQRRSDEFTRNQSDEFLGLFDDVQRQAAPTFNDLIRGFADMEAASGDSAEAIRATMDGFLDSESLEAAARIQSFIDSFDALSRSDLNTEDKRKAIEELQRQFAEGETANLAEYGVEIETANEYAKRTTQERLDDVLAMEKDTNERIYEAKEETAARIVTIQQEANADIQKSIEALGDVFGREFGSNVTSAEGLRAKLVEVKGQVDALVGQEYNVVINYVTNGVPGAPSASPAIDPARQAASHIRP